jgi:hypothetical protein
MKGTRNLVAGGIAVSCLLALLVSFRQPRRNEHSIDLPRTEEIEPEATRSATPPAPRAGLAVVEPQRPERRIGLTPPSAWTLDQTAEDEYVERDDLSEPTLVEEDDETKRTSSVELAKTGLEALTQQSSDNFLKLFSLLEGSGQYEQRPVAKARDATQAYLQRRTELLQRSWTSFIESEGKVVDVTVLGELRALESSFQEQMQELEPSVPAVGALASMIASTSHPLPFFANRDAPELPQAN